MSNYYVYIITNQNNKVLYVGMTKDLHRRIYEHKHKLLKGFSLKYNCSKLVFYESSSDVKSIIQREKEIKGWRREKKIKLIENINPNWDDLSENL